MSPLLGAIACAPEPGPTSGDLIRWVLVQDAHLGNEVELTYVSRIRRGPNATILVAEGVSGSILMFGPDGNLQRRFGRRGGGPGEFQYLGTIGSVGDSVWGIDFYTGQISLFASTSHEVRAWRMHVDDGPPFMQPAALLANGMAVISGFRRINGQEGEHLVLRARWDGAYPDTVLRILTTSTEWRLEMIETTQPLADDPLYAISPDGSFIALVDVRAPDAVGDSITLTLYRDDGQEVYRRHVPFPRERVTTQLVDSVIDHKTHDLRLRNIPRRSVENGLYVPAYMPPVAAVLVDSLGEVWLKAARASAGFDWLVVDPEGVPAGTVDVPANARIMVLDGGVWGVVRDEDGVPQVLRWRLARADSTAGA